MHNIQEKKLYEGNSKNKVKNKESNVLIKKPKNQIPV